MKHAYKVTLSHTVTMTVCAENINEIQDWITEHTPNEAKELAKKQTGNYIKENYSEEIVCSMPSNTLIDYHIDSGGIK